MEHTDIMVDDYGNFYVIEKRTEKTVTLYPIGHTFEGYADGDVWVTMHMPNMRRESNAFCKGTIRRKIGIWGTVHICKGVDASIWDGMPALVDHYN